MQETIGPHKFNIITTADDSPSLLWESGEAMHNLKGALSESLEIYGKAFLEASSLSPSTKVLSVGLGLAYNELIIAALNLSRVKQDVEVMSFEENDFLRDYWFQWLKNENNELTVCHDIIATSLKNKFELAVPEMKKYIFDQYQNLKWKLSAQLNDQTAFSDKYNCIIYDPFSSKTNPICWDEDFLNDFIHKSCADNCVFSTYSSKGNLKRALKKQGFDVQNPEGFGGKRNRTMAIRRKN